MRGLLTIFSALFLGLSALHAQQTPGAPKRAGYTASSEGGIEGKQFIHYDEEGRVIESNLVNPLPTKKVEPRPLPEVTRSPVAKPSVEPVGPPVSQGMYTADGRKLPFSIEGKGGAKTVDDSVDFNAALKKASKGSDLLEKRYEVGNATLTEDTPYSREANLLSFDSWHGKYDTFGRVKSDIEVADSFDRGEPRAKNTVEIKSIEREESIWSRKMTDIAGVDERLTTEKNSKFSVAPLPAKEQFAPKTLQELSMQDINRYQFRRNRSDEPGLPFVRPGSDQVQTLKSGSQ